MKRIILILVLLTLPLVCFGQDATTQATPKHGEQPLQLVIQSDRAEYAVGDEINISYTLKNIVSKPVGFYIADRYNYLGVDVFDSRGNKYNDFTSATQFDAPSIYPDEYVVINPGEQRNGSISFALEKGELKEFYEAKSGPKGSGKVVYRTIHDGLYLKCTKGCPYFLENIILSKFSKGAIKVSLQYITDNPNPNNFTKKDCEKARIALDVFPEDSKSNKINQAVLCEGGACSDNPIDWDNVNNLAVYCQHYTALTKDAWIGTLTSNTITIEVAEKK